MQISPTASFADRRGKTITINGTLKVFLHKETKMTEKTDFNTALKRLESALDAIVADGVSRARQLKPSTAAVSI